MAFGQFQTSFYVFCYPVLIFFIKVLKIKRHKEKTHMASIIAVISTKTKNKGKTNERPKNLKEVIMTGKGRARHKEGGVWMFLRLMNSIMPSAMTHFVILEPIDHGNLGRSWKIIAGQQEEPAEGTSRPGGNGEMCISPTDFGFLGLATVVSP